MVARVQWSGDAAPAGTDWPTKNHNKTILLRKSNNSYTGPIERKPGQLSYKRVIRPLQAFGQMTSPSLDPMMVHGRQLQSLSIPTTMRLPTKREAGRWSNNPAQEWSGSNPILKY